MAVLKVSARAGTVMLANRLARRESMGLIFTSKSR
jgi:hypothetical protein